MQLISEEIALLLDYSADARNTESFEIPSWATFIGVFIPTFTVDAVVRLQISRDNGANFVYVLDQADGEPVEICASGSDPAYVDISDWLRAFLGAPNQNVGRKYKVRFVHYDADETTSDKTFYVVCRA